MVPAAGNLLRRVDGSEVVLPGRLTFQGMKGETVGKHTGKSFLGKGLQEKLFAIISGSRGVGWEGTVTRRALFLPGCWTI